MWSSGIFPDVLYEPESVGRFMFGELTQSQKLCSELPSLLWCPLPFALELLGCRGLLVNVYI